MKIKVLLINPTSENNTTHIRVGRCQTKGQPGIDCWPPIDLALICAAIRKKCKFVETDLYDAQLRPGYNNMLRHIILFDPNIVIINCTTPTFHNDIALAQYIKQNAKDVLIVFFGLHATVEYYEILKTSYVDCCIIGEPEETLQTIVHHYAELGKCDFKEILNIAYLNENREIIINNFKIPDKSVFLSLYPDRSVLQNENYRLQYNNKPYTIIQTSRGCHYNCIFCTSSVYSKEYVVRTVNSVILEIRECVDKYNITNFMFLSDTFTADRKWIQKFCEEIINNRIKIKWMSNSRVDTIDPDLALLMHRAGCWLVSLGIESANQKILDNIKKGTTLDQSKNAIVALKNAKIKVIGYFIFGLPGETFETIKETISFAQKSQLDYAYFFHSTPFPGTALYKYAKENNLLLNLDWRYYTHGENVTMSCKGLTQIELEKAVRCAYRKFYMRPRVIINQMLTIRSWKVLHNNIRAVISLLQK